MTGGPTDRGTFAPQQPCACTPTCEVLHSDRAESAEQLEIYRLRAELQRVRAILADHSRKWQAARTQNGRQIGDLKDHLSATFKARDAALVEIADLKVQRDQRQELLVDVARICGRLGYPLTSIPGFVEEAIKKAAADGYHNGLYDSFARGGA